MTQTSYWQVSDSDLDQHFKDVKRTYDWECTQHRRRWDRYYAIPLSIRERPKVSAQIFEDLSEFRQAPGKYEDTLFGQVMSVLADVTEKGEATFEELSVVEEFVGRLKGQNKRLEKAVKKLESYGEKSRCD